MHSETRVTFLYGFEFFLEFLHFLLGFLFLSSANFVISFYYASLVSDRFAIFNWLLKNICGYIVIYISLNKYFTHFVIIQTKSSFGTGFWIILVYSYFIFFTITFFSNYVSFLFYFLSNLFVFLKVVVNILHLQEFLGKLDFP